MNPLKQKLDLLGTIAGALGAAMCGLAVLMRLSLGPGNHEGIIIAPRNILIAGTAVMVFGCWLKLSAK